jgi:hypothetical protein
VYDIWRSAGGEFICAQVDVTQDDGANTRHTSAVCSDVAGVIAFFGQSDTVKALYDQAGIAASQRVE